MADVRCAVCAAKLADGSYVCHSCATKLERRLRDAAALWDDLAITVVPRLTRLGDPTPRAGRPAPAEPIRPDSGAMRHYADQSDGMPSGLPTNLAASYTADSVRNTLTTWARVIAEGVHADPPTDMDDLTRWVAGRLSWARYEQWAAEMFDELHYAAGLLWQVCDRQAERVYLGPCGEPDGLAGACPADLYARHGASTVRCAECGTRHSVAERRHWLDGLVLDYAYTATEIAAAYVRIKRNTISQWAVRGRLTQHGTDRHGRATYLLRDVLALADVTRVHSGSA